MDVEGADKEGVRVDRGDGGKYVGSQSKYAGGSGLHGVGGGGSSQRWRKQACKENDRHIKWTVRLDHIGVRCIRNNTAGLSVSYKLGPRWDDVITWSDFKSEAIFGFLSPNYTRRSA